jgi:methylenetetrahydrofolate--tRNA-(uracil-5-)-methyltransferase
VPEDASGKLWRLAGMGTGLTPDEQQWVFGQLPGLAGMEIVRPGRAVRSVFLPAAAVVARSGRVTGCEGLFLAGQLLGTANYVEAAATGWLAGVNAVRWACRRKPALIPRQTMFGALVHRLTESDSAGYQPVPVDFGMLPVLPEDANLPKEERRQLQVGRSEAALADFVAEQIPEVGS